MDVRLWRKTTVSTEGTASGAALVARCRPRPREFGWMVYFVAHLGLRRGAPHSRFLRCDPGNGACLARFDDLARVGCAPDLAWRRRQDDCFGRAHWMDVFLRRRQLSRNKSVLRLIRRGTPLFGCMWHPCTCSARHRNDTLFGWLEWQLGWIFARGSDQLTQTLLVRIRWHAADLVQGSSDGFQSAHQTGHVGFLRGAWHRTRALNWLEYSRRGERKDNECCH